jgi:hypothetical protein
MPFILLHASDGQGKSQGLLQRLLASAVEIMKFQKGLARKEDSLKSETERHK